MLERIASRSLPWFMMSRIFSSKAAAIRFNDSANTPISRMLLTGSLCDKIAPREAFRSRFEHFQGADDAARTPEA